MAERLFQIRGDIDVASALVNRRRCHAQLEQIERDPRVAVRVQRNRPQRVRVDDGLLAAESAIGIAQGSFEDREHLVRREPAQHEHLGA